MRNVLFLATALILVLVGCTPRNTDLYDPNAVALRNAEKLFGEIDPNQNWNSTYSGSITITADASLHDVARVLVLTVSPVLNDQAKVLAEADVSKGQTVTLDYDVPNVYQELIAACVDSKGHYFMKAFKVTDTKVSFKSTAAQARRVTRAGEDYLDASAIKLERSKSEQSYNALRAIFANEADATGDATMQGVVSKGNIGQWAGSGWENDRLWKPTDNYKTGTEWEVRNQTVVRVIDPMTAEEESQLKTLFGNFLERSDTKETWGKKDNRKYVLEKMRESDAVNFYNNQLTSDGTTPITIIPIFMPSTEIGSCHLYYYYYDPKVVPAGTTEADYIKALPKFKAIQCWHSRSAANSKGKGTNDLFKVHEYLLPYYGDELQDVQNAVSLAIPKGYRVGFMLRKLKDTGTFVQNYRDITDVGHGCCYGFGKLNKEINKMPGHFGSGVTYFSMEEDDSRVCMFSANGKSYLAFEDGSDCNYNDMIIEVGGYDKNVLTEAPEGTEEKGSGIETDYLYDEDEIEGAPYMLCFEDRFDTADYDMNDVVLRCKRQTGVNKNRVELSLVAAGGEDDVVIMGIKGTYKKGYELNNHEVHEIFDVENETGENRFVNTIAGKAMTDPCKGIYELEEGLTIPQFLAGIYLKNLSTGREIRVSRTGEAPLAIIMPYDFEYPMEKVNITKAYTSFIHWAHQSSEYTDWYTHITSGSVYPVSELFK